MSDIFTIYNIIIGILVAFLILLLYITRNLLLKNEKYEDVVRDQTQYLQNISNAIGEGEAPSKSRRERGLPVRR